MPCAIRHTIVIVTAAMHTTAVVNPLATSKQGISIFWYVAVCVCMPNFKCMRDAAISRLAAVGWR